MKSSVHGYSTQKGPTQTTQNSNTAWAVPSRPAVSVRKSVRTRRRELT